MKDASPIELRNYDEKLRSFDFRNLSPLENRLIGKSIKLDNGEIVSVDEILRLTERFTQTGEGQEFLLRPLNLQQRRKTIEQIMLERSMLPQFEKPILPFMGRFANFLDARRVRVHMAMAEIDLGTGLAIPEWNLEFNTKNKQFLIQKHLVVLAKNTPIQFRSLFHYDLLESPNALQFALNSQHPSHPTIETYLTAA